MRGITEVVFWKTQAAFSTSDWHPHQTRTWPVWSERGGAQVTPGITLCWWTVSMNRKYLFVLNASCAFDHWFLSLRTKVKVIISLLNHRPWNILNFYRLLPPGLRPLIYYLTDLQCTESRTHTRQLTHSCWMNDSYLRLGRVKIKSPSYDYYVSIL